MFLGVSGHPEPRHHHLIALCPRLGDNLVYLLALVLIPTIALGPPQGFLVTPWALPQPSLCSGT